jgi:hypothetical protein
MDWIAIGAGVITLIIIALVLMALSIPNNWPLFFIGLAIALLLGVSVVYPLLYSAITDITTRPSKAMIDESPDVWTISGTPVHTGITPEAGQGRFIDKVRCIVNGKIVDSIEDCPPIVRVVDQMPDGSLVFVPTAEIVEDQLSDETLIPSPTATTAPTETAIPSPTATPLPTETVVPSPTATMESLRPTETHEYIPPAAPVPDADGGIVLTDLRQITIHGAATVEYFKGNTQYWTVLPANTYLIQPIQKWGKYWDIFSSYEEAVADLNGKFTITPWQQASVYEENGKPVPLFKPIH